MNIRDLGRGSELRAMRMQSWLSFVILSTDQSKKSGSSSGSSAFLALLKLFKYYMCMLFVCVSFLAFVVLFVWFVCWLSLSFLAVCFPLPSWPFLCCWSVPSDPFNHSTPQVSQLWRLAFFVLFVWFVCWLLLSFLAVFFLSAFLASSPRAASTARPARGNVRMHAHLRICSRGCLIGEKTLSFEVREKNMLAWSAMKPSNMPPKLNVCSPTKLPPLQQKARMKHAAHPRVIQCAMHNDNHENDSNNVDDNGTTITSVFSCERHARARRSASTAYAHSTANF